MPSNIFIIFSKYFINILLNLFLGTSHFGCYCKWHLLKSIRLPDCGFMYRNALMLFLVSTNLVVK